MCNTCMRIRKQTKLYKNMSWKLLLVVYVWFWNTTLFRSSQTEWQTLTFFTTVIVFMQPDFLDCFQKLHFIVTLTSSIESIKNTVQKTSKTAALKIGDGDTSFLPRIHSIGRLGQFATLPNRNAIQGILNGTKVIVSQYVDEIAIQFPQKLKMGWKTKSIPYSFLDQKTVSRL